jgi:sortase A
MTFPLALLRLAQPCLFGLAAASLCYYAYSLVEMSSFQDHQEARFSQLLAATPRENAVPAASQTLMGRLQIPRLKVSAIVVKGTGEQDLKLGVGHIAGTTMPGTPGNVGLAGHRDTFFRPLRNIRPQDAIHLTTMEGEFHYRVVSTQIVPPTGVEVLTPGGGEVLTLVTCYPFFLLGTAPDRFIVRAERVR